MWHSKSTANAQAHDLCRCSVNDGLAGVKRCRKREITPKTPTLLNNVMKIKNSFNVEYQIQVRWVSTTKNNNNLCNTNEINKTFFV